MTVLGLVVPAEASAAHDLYAAPVPHGTHDCSAPEKACLLGQATAANSAAGDTILVTAAEGAYTFSSQVIESDPNVTIRGISGRPRLQFDGDGLWIHGGGTSRVSNLLLESPSNSSGQLLSMHAGSADNVI